MAKAEWQGAVIAQSETFEVVEGNVYFPRASVNPAHLADSATHTTCGWKGTALYYPTPKTAAANITDHIAFWRGVVVTR